MPSSQTINGPSNSPTLASGWFEGGSGTTPKERLTAADGGYLWGIDPVGDQSVEFDFDEVPATATITQLVYRVRARYVGSAMDIRLAIAGSSTFPALAASYADEVLTVSSGLGSPDPGGGKTYTGTFRSANGTDGDIIEVDQVRATLTWNSLPDAPTSLTPAADATLTTLTPTFTGTRVDADGDAMTAVQIEVRRVSDNVEFMSGSVDRTASGSAFSVPYAGTTLVSGTTYKWRARTKEAAGYGTWSSYRNFTPVINAAPTATLSSPAAGAQVGTLTPALVVNFSDPDTGTDGEFGAYQIQVRRVSDAVSFLDTDWVSTTAGQKTANQASHTYNGTALVNATAYEWRARVRDSSGLPSDYTAWRTFTPAVVPNPPTITGPSGLTNTLTPTIAGTYNQGSGGTEDFFQYELRAGGVTIYSSGDVAADIATGQVYGTANAGDTPADPPALSWGTSYQVRARSKDNAGAYSDWSGYTSFNTNAAPTTPTGRTPNGGITGDTTPTLSWTHNDADGDAQTEAEIELRKVSDDSAVTGYAPKTLVQAGTTHTVTETLVDSPATEYKWRVRTKGTAGPGFGPWSDWATFTVAAVPIVTVAEPDPSDVITAPSLLTEWAFSGGSGTQATYRVRILAADGTTVVYDSGTLAGTDVTHQVPATGGLRNGLTYYVRVTLVDTLAQEADSGLIEISTAWTPPAVIAGVTVTLIGDQST